MRPCSAPPRRASSRGAPRRRRRAGPTAPGRSRRSSFGSRRSPRCTRVTRLPRRAKACAISHPIAPPPSTSSVSGSSSRSHSVSFVSTSTPSGTTGALPVADERVTETDADPPRRPASGAVEAAATAQGVHARLGEGLGRVDGCDRGDRALHVRHHGGEIHADVAGVDAEPPGIPCVLRRVGRGDERFRGNAPGEQAFAAEPVRLDEQHTRPEHGAVRDPTSPALPAPITTRSQSPHPLPRRR